MKRLIEIARERTKKGSWRAKERYGEKQEEKEKYDGHRRDTT